MPQLPAFAFGPTLHKVIGTALTVLMLLGVELQAHGGDAGIPAARIALIYSFLQVALFGLRFIDQLLNPGAAVAPMNAANIPGQTGVGPVDGQG